MHTLTASNAVSGSFIPIDTSTGYLERDVKIVSELAIRGDWTGEIYLERKLPGASFPSENEWGRVDTISKNVETQFVCTKPDMEYRFSSNITSGTAYIAVI